MRVGRGADDDERALRGACRVPLDDHVDVVLRLEPGDHEVVATRSQAELGEALVPDAGQVGGSVREEAAVGVVLLAVVVDDARRVRDEGVREPHGSRLGGPVVPPAGRPPLGAAPFQTVDVRGDRDAHRAQHGQ